MPNKRWHGWVLEIEGLAEGAVTEQLTVGKMEGQFIAGVVVKGHAPPLVVTCILPVQALIFESPDEALGFTETRFGLQHDGQPVEPFKAFEVRPVPVEMVPGGWG